MSVDGSSRDEIKQRIQPTLDNVAVEGLRAWLRSVELSDSARARPALTELIAEQIAKGKLTEPALEKALVGFEEASEMRTYLFRLEETPYGTVSYIVVLRTREVGIRMALGSTRSDVLILIMREVARLVLAGLAAGMVLAIGASYLLRGVLYGLSRVDSVSFAGISLLFVGVALIATWLPSRRAMRVDPMVALRCE
jgi:hypothetical protein